MLIGFPKRECVATSMTETVFVLELQTKAKGVAQTTCADIRHAAVSDFRWRKFIVRTSADFFAFKTAFCVGINYFTSRDEGHLRLRTHIAI